MFNHLFIISVRREPSPCCHEPPDCPGPRLEDGKDYDNELPLIVCVIKMNRQKKMWIRIVAS